MRKNYLVAVMMLSAVSLFAQSDDYYVQVGVYETQVDINYFNEIGSNVFHSKDNYGFHRYYKGVYNSEEEAKSAQAKFKEKGYNSYLVPKLALGNNACACNYIPMPKSILNTIQNIFFDFDSANLRAESKRQLRDLKGIMRDFPEYTTVLRAHTDAKGSNAYNDALSMRRASSAKRYLNAIGIASSRIETETFGEVKPIAKNELSDGQDTEEGRQFNRRVEILIKDKHGNIINEIVDEIDIPRGLENSSQG